MRKTRPFRAGRRLVEAGGQRVPWLSPRPGLCLHPCRLIRQACGACYPAEALFRIRILVLAPNASVLRRVYESLQGRAEVGPLPTPRRYHAAVVVSTAPSGFTDVSSVFIRSLRIGATL